MHRILCMQCRHTYYIHNIRVRCNICKEVEIGLLQTLHY